MKTPILQAHVLPLSPLSQGEVIIRRWATLGSAVHVRNIRLSGCGTRRDPTLTLEEHEAVVYFWTKYNNGRIENNCRCSSNDTMIALQRATSAKNSGATVCDGNALLYKTTQKGLIEHFTYVAGSRGIPMIPL